jgi:hypothetical protein
LNIHGAIDLETGQTIMKDVLSVDAMSTILLLTAIEALYPGMRLIHVFWIMPDTIMQNWFRPGSRGRTAGSGSTSSRLTARTSIRSNDCGA